MTTKARYDEVETTLAALARDDSIPEWLVRSLRIANEKAEVLLLPQAAPAEPPRFHYPH
jgi:hypothetical protein